MKFTEGDAVKVLTIAPESLHPGSGGSVCGSRTLESVEVVNDMTEERGTILYLVEFGDGTAIEMAERFLAPYED